MRVLRISLLLIFAVCLACIVQAFPGDGPLIEATIVLDKKQTGEDADRELKVSAVSSEGFIQGSEGSQKHFIQFKDIEKIVFDLNTHAYTVKTWEGKTYVLKYAKLNTHNTSPTFDCMVIDEAKGTPVEQGLDYTQFKSVVFKKSAAPVKQGSSAAPSEKVAAEPVAAAPAEVKTLDKQEVIRCWKEMIEIYDRNELLFNQMNGGRFTSTEEYQKWLKEMETFLQKDLVTVQTILANARQNGQNSNDISNSWRKIAGNDAPFEGSRGVDALIMNLENGLKYIDSGRKDTAASLLQGAEDELNGISNFAENIRPEIFKRNRVALEMAKRYDPQNASVIQWLAKIDDLETSVNAKAEKDMNEFVFPGHNKAFSGPGNADELAKAALAYFNSTCKPNEKAVKASVIEKEWYCYKRNIFGQPTIWALTFMVAVQLEEDKAKGITRAWSISFLTEERPDIAKAPPFQMAAFNQSYKMKTANLK